MNLQFYKYHGTGNDFVLFDNRDNVIAEDNYKWFAQLCHRRFGIGADGVMLLQNKTGYDFEMKYYNADGNESTMCGNGGRCIVKLAQKLGVIENKAHFLAIDGAHDAVVLDNGDVQLKMNDIATIEETSGDYVLNTGSPHYVTFVDGIDNFDVFANGRKIRQGAPFTNEGINVNFLQWQGNTLNVRTYERGVEDETYSCGTGVVAAAVANAVKGNVVGENEVAIKTLGGNLSVRFNRNDNNTITDVWLIGPATFVFEGEINKPI